MLVWDCFSLRYHQFPNSCYTSCREKLELFASAGLVCLQICWFISHLSAAALHTTLFCYIFYECYMYDTHYMHPTCSIEYIIPTCSIKYTMNIADIKKNCRLKWSGSKLYLRLPVHMLPKNSWRIHNYYIVGYHMLHALVDSYRESLVCKIDCVTFINVHVAFENLRLNVALFYAICDARSSIILMSSSLFI